MKEPDQTAPSIAAASSPVPARQRVEAWAEQWRRTGRLVLLLDFDGTLAPIVERPEMAAMPEATRKQLERFLSRPDVDVAVVSGRGLADARERVGVRELAYAGNHGMEIEGSGLRQIHPEAAAARPVLERVMEHIARRLEPIQGAFVEDKGLTLSVHYRQADRSHVPRVRDVVHEAAADEQGLRITEGKEVLEIRPRVEWDKGRAVEFLLHHFQPPAGTPVLYIGDDTTDEDAFRALQQWPGRSGEGVVVGDPAPEHTAAGAYVASPDEVADLLGRLADAAPPAPAV